LCFVLVGRTVKRLRGIYVLNTYNIYRKMRHKHNRKIDNQTGTGDDRAVAPVIGAVMLVMITAMVAGAFTVSALGFTDNIDDEPAVGPCELSSESAASVHMCEESVAEMSMSADSTTSAGAGIEINHMSGEPIASEDMRIEIDAPGGNAVMEGINENGITDAYFCWYNSDECRLKDATVQRYEDPNNIIDSGGATSKVPAVMEEGDTTYFRLSNNAEMDEGSATLTVTHTPTGTELINQEVYGG
jgi:flagellin-like protein